DLVIACVADVLHARLLHDAPRCGVLRIRDGVDLVEATLAKAIRKARARGLGRIATTPPFLSEVVRDLDLGAASFDQEQTAVTNELAGLLQLHGPESEAVLALVRDESFDRRARAL